MPNGNDETAPKPAAENSWMGDVQRALAMILIGSLALVGVFLTIRLIFIAEAEDLLSMATTLQAALVNMALIALGFFFGSNKASKDKDETISKIAMTPPPTPVIAPIATNGVGPVTVVTTAPSDPSTTVTTTTTTEEPKKD